MKCPICDDSLVPVKLSPGTVTHEHQTGCAFVWNDLTAPQITVLCDAALGAAVRKMPAWTFVYRNSVGWFSGTEMSHGTRKYGPKADTPEDALKAAGMMEVEK